MESSYKIHKVNRFEKRNVIYLVLLLVLSFQFWGLKPMGTWSNNAYLIIKVAYLAIGYFFLFHYKVTISDKRLKPMWFILLGIFLSMVTANLYYGQTYITSLLAYRANILWLAIPVLFKMKPTFEQISKSCLIVTAIMYVLYFVRLGNPGLFALDDETLMRMQQGDDVYLEGYVIACVPIFYGLNQLRERFNVKAVEIIGFCYVYLVILQNRSCLFIMTLLIGYSILKVKSKYRIFLVVILGAILAFFIASMSKEWMDLIQETQDNMSNSDYNRNKAYLYFLTMASPNIWCEIFGNGFLSSHTTNLMQDMMAYGIFNSDVGFVGYWNQYGIIPIITFIYTFILALKKDVPYGVKMWCLLLVGCTPTISYFHGAPLIYVFYYYLVIQYSRHYLIKETK